MSTFYPVKHVLKMSPGKVPTSHSHIEQWKLSGKFPEAIRMNYAIYFLYSGSHSFLQETGYIVFCKNHYYKDQQPDKQQTSKNTLRIIARLMCWAWDSSSLKKSVYTFLFYKKPFCKKPRATKRKKAKKLRNWRAARFYHNNVR